MRWFDTAAFANPAWRAYNLLNRTNFDIPGYTFGAADFGVISSARPARPFSSEQS